MSWKQKTQMHYPTKELGIEFVEEHVTCRDLSYEKQGIMLYDYEWNIVFLGSICVVVKYFSSIEQNVFFFSLVWLHH